MSLGTTIDFIETNPIARELAGEAAKSTAQGAVLHWGSRLGARLIPGVGTALLAYDVAQGVDFVAGFGCKLITGREWTDTAVGRAVHSTLEKTDELAAKASGVVVDGASSLLSTLGFGKAAEKVGSWGKYLLCGDDGKPVANETIAENPVLRRGDQRPATAADLPTPPAPTGPTANDRLCLAALMQGSNPAGPEINGAMLAELVGSPATTPDRDLAARDQRRLATRAPRDENAALADRLNSLETPRATRPTTRQASSGMEIG